jgi:hypothetical protein
MSTIPEEVSFTSPQRTHFHDDSSTINTREQEQRFNEARRHQEAEPMDAETGSSGSSETSWTYDSDDSSEDSEKARMREEIARLKSRVQSQVHQGINQTLSQDSQDTGGTPTTPKRQKDNKGQAAPAPSGDGNASVDQSATTRVTRGTQDRSEKRKSTRNKKKKDE